MGYYDEAEPTCKVSILGTDYNVYIGVSRENDPFLDHCDGYCDKTVKRCVVAGISNDSELGDFSIYEKTNLRHELIHAFLFESGLDGNSFWGNGEDDHPEQIVEWMAIQFPKLLRAFKEAQAL